jgi:hypothetical protein
MFYQNRQSVWGEKYFDWENPHSKKKLNLRPYVLCATLHDSEPLLYTANCA